MSEPYVAEGVLGFLAALAEKGLLTSRPVRIDGFTLEEIEAVLSAATEAVAPGRVAVLAETTSEHTLRIDSDRATRYRNEIDAGEGRGFVLFVPQGQPPESSLNEPAFLVTPRDRLFREALARRRRELDLSSADIEGIRQVSRYRQSEAVFSFLSAWDDVAGTIDPAAPFRSLGLLSHSGLGGMPDTVVERLRRNATATEIVGRPGLSPTRLLEELAAKVDLIVAEYGDRVLDLAVWWHGGQRGSQPEALDFALWPTMTEADEVDIDFEPDLRLPPHRGWKDQGGQAVVDKAAAATTVEWQPQRVPSGVRYALQLIEASSQQAVISSLGGKSTRPRRSVKWSRVLSGPELLDQLRSLDPGGEENGYSFVLRLVVLRGSASIREYDSQPFVVTIGDNNVGVSSAPSPTLYHALYQFHSEQSAESPEISPDDALPNAVRLESANGRVRDAAMDVSGRLLEIEQEIVDTPSAIGPLVVRPGETTGGAGLRFTPGRSILAADLPPYLIDARRHLFELISGRGPLESIPWRDEPFRGAAIQYVSAFQQAVEGTAIHARAAGGVAGEDQLRCAQLMSADTVKVMIPDEQGEFPLLLVPPIHPVSLAWIIDFADLCWAWSRGDFEAGSKPSYAAVIEHMAAGPRSMAWATAEHGAASPRWWGYGGNVTGTWQCFVPIGDDEDVRSRDWSGALLDALELPARPVGGGALDARRVGMRLKKYAVLHPYVNQLSLAVLTSGDALDLLEALRVIDEKPGTPAGAASVRELRYEVTVIGPQSPNLASAIDGMVADPGDARWSRYSNAILDNPETVLAPGFSYARRAIHGTDSEISGLWDGARRELDGLGARGVHVALLGAMLTAQVASTAGGPTALTRGGLAARPRTTIITPENQRSPYQGDWVLSIGAGNAPESLSELAVADLATALALACGQVGPGVEVGLSVKLAGPMARVLRKVHQVSDWVIVSDPLFTIELMDQRRRAGHDTVMLDYTPEFDPYPGGRVVVTTNSIADVDDVAAKASVSGEQLAAVLSSVSARLLLTLSNPTKQTVGGLRGLALTRAFIARRLPGALVVPVDGHEDMFVSKKAYKSGTLADLVAISITPAGIAFHVFESKYSESAAIGSLLEGGRVQARATADVLQDEYVAYSGLDRRFRLEALREIVLFHLARAKRHGVPVSFTERAVWETLGDDSLVRSAEVSCAVVGWTPLGVANAGPVTGSDGVDQWLMGGDDIEDFSAIVGAWPPEPVRTAPPEGGTSAAAEPARTAPPEGGTSAAAEPVRTAPPEGGTSAAAEAARTAPPEGDTPATAAPATFAPVPRPSPIIGNGLDQAATDPECVILGSITASGKPALWCPPLLSNGHLVLIGGSGAGKTTALRHITAQIRARGIPVLVLDFHGDITAVATPERLYRFEYAGNSAFINPFHPGPKVQPHTAETARPVHRGLEEALLLDGCPAIQLSRRSHRWGVRGKGDYIGSRDMGTRRRFRGCDCSI